MNSPSQTGITPADLERVHDLYDRGLYLQAYRLLETFGPLEDLAGTAARLIAARVLGQLGADRRSAGLFFRALRSDRHNLEARYYYIRTVLQRRGPFAAWKLLRKPISPEHERASGQFRAEWYALQAGVLGALRDFDRAEDLIQRADELSPEHPWILVERSGLLEDEDRYEEALAACKRCLEIRPFYGAAVHGAARFLQLLGRDAEALELLSDASDRLESGLMTAQLLVLQTELGHYAAARRTLERFATLSPFVDKAREQWVASMKFEIAYNLGELEEAVAQARQSGSPNLIKIAGYMDSAPASPRRVVLPVSFVRQHHMTCAPATLSALSGFWNMPADHLEIAEAICYDGTPWHSERAWAEEHGWHTREFKVTWETAVSLLDRGVPFTLTTTGPGYAHLQAVVGYDERQGVLLIRDPYIPYLGTALGREMLQDLRPYGPRGMALVPRASADLLADVALADCSFYDALHSVERALQAHNREDAVRTIAEMSAADSDHPITLHARRALAAYDTDLPGTLAVIEAMRAQFPEEPNLALAHLGCLREMGRREERLHLLETLTARPLPRAPAEVAGEVDTTAEVRRMTPIYWQQYARELSEDAREHPRALTLLARAMRYAPADGNNLATLASMLWDEQRFEEAAELYRFAACLSPYAEHYSRSYFIASRWLGKTDEALAFLRGRCARLGSRSHHPVCTLFQAMEQLGRMTEAFALLDEAISRRPEDGELLLFASEEYGRYARFEQARALLKSAELRVSRAAWLRGQAKLAAFENNTAQALALWKEIAETEPLAMDALAEFPRLLTQIEGPGAVSHYFETLVGRFPHHAGIHRQWALWLRGQDETEKQIDVLRQLRDINPADAWARRELGVVLARERAFAEAMTEAETARALEPTDPASYSILGEVCSLAGRMEEARVHFRRALALRIDDAGALQRLVSLCDTPQETREVLQFAAGQIARQHLFGDSLLAFRYFAHRALPAPEVYSLIHGVLSSRPDLWQAWSAIIDELRETDRLAEAAHVAEQATARFPLRPELWQDLAAVRAAQGAHAAEREALRKALEVAPGYGPILRQLVGSLERSGDLPAALETAKTAVSWNPMDGQNHALLAYCLWHSGEREAALVQVHYLLRLDPGSVWAWDVLRPWSAEMGRGSEAEQTARDLAASRPGDVRSWLMLARLLERPEELAERLQALDRALVLNQRCHEASDLKAELLSDARRFEEALQACRLPDTPEDGLPIRLRARIAQIEADRGDLKQAIRKMEEALRDDPAHYDGWLQLLRWRRHLNDENGALEAARNLTRLRPHDSLAWVYLAQTHFRARQRAEAKAALRRSLELEPGSEFAAQMLLEAQLVDHDVQAAEKTISTVMPHRHEGWPLVLAMRFAANQRDAAAVCSLLRELCLLPGNMDTALRQAEDALSQAVLVKEIQAVCERLLETDTVQPEVGALWARSCARMNHWQEMARLASLRPRGEVGFRAAGAWIIALADNQRKQSLTRLIKEDREWLRGHATTWGAVAYGLFTMRDFKEVLRWTVGWRDRPDTRPWMLLNRALAYRHLKQPAEAAEVSRAALSLPEDNCTVRHALWLLADSLLQSEPQEAAPLLGFLKDVEPARLPGYYRSLYYITAALRTVLDASPADRPRAFAEARKQMRSARASYTTLWSDRVLRGHYERAARKIARESGVPWSILWQLFHLRVS